MLTLTHNDEVKEETYLDSPIPQGILGKSPAAKIMQESNFVSSDKENNRRTVHCRTQNHPNSSAATNRVIIHNKHILRNYYA